MDYKFLPHDLVQAKRSGKVYSIIRQRHWETDEPRYCVVGWRNGKAFGPIRTMREASLELART